MADGWFETTPMDPPVLNSSMRAMFVRFAATANWRGVSSVAPDHRTEQQATQMTARYRNQAIELAPIRNTIKDLQAQVQTLGIPTTLVMSENPAVTHPSATIRIRGSFTSKSDEVQAAIPSF